MVHAIAGSEDKRSFRLNTVLLVAAFVGGILGLPAAAWLDLRALSDSTLAAQAKETARVIDIVRSFYSTDVVGRVLSAHGKVTTAHDYTAIDGAIPIPATLSIELGNRISATDAPLAYRFVSDLPFRGRAHHPLDTFETDALNTLRTEKNDSVVDVSGSIFDRKIRLATPVVMGPVCVGCHNIHPDSPKTDWKVGDVRGIQEISLEQPIRAHIFAFKYLLAYLLTAAAVGLAVIDMQRRQSALIGAVNRELSEANDFLASLSIRIAKYISPRIYKAVFSGQSEAPIPTERKVLTVLHARLAGFDAMSERWAPDQTTRVLNDYLTAVAALAAQFGGAVDRYAGDAMQMHFGDPETLGAREDARACLKTAVAMRAQLDQLNTEWRRAGLDAGLSLCIGIHTGSCAVGGFGSDDRMDIGIVGPETKVAALLCERAAPGEIVVSSETLALLGGLAATVPRPSFKAPGLAQPVVPHLVEALGRDSLEGVRVIREKAAGLDLFLDLDALDERAAAKAAQRLHEALDALENRRDGKPARNRSAQPA